MTSAIDRLATLQRAMSAALRRAAGPSAEADASLAAHLVGGEAALSRIAIYHQQCWHHQLEIAREEHRLAAALIGPAHFDALLREFLAARPPRGHDRAAVCAGLDDFLAEALPDAGIELADHGRVPRDALVDAVRVDRAFQHVVMAGPPPRFKGTISEVAGRPTARLVPSGAVVLVDERWPLVSLRRQLVLAPETRAALPRPHASMRTWLLAGKSRGVLALPVVAPHARLLRELATRPIGEAIAAVQATCDARDAELVARSVHSWLTRSFDVGMWSSVDRAAG